MGNCLPLHVKVKQQQGSKGEEEVGQEMRWGRVYFCSLLILDVPRDLYLFAGFDLQHALTWLTTNLGGCVGSTLNSWVWRQPCDSSPSPVSGGRDRQVFAWSKLSLVVWVINVGAGSCQGMFGTNLKLGNSLEQVKLVLWGLFFFFLTHSWEDSEEDLVLIGFHLGQDLSSVSSVPIQCTSETCKSNFKYSAHFMTLGYILCCQFNLHK